MHNTLSILNRGLLEKKKNVAINFTNNNLLLVKIFYSNGYVLNYRVLYNKIHLQFNVFNNKFIFNSFKLYKNFNNKKFVTLKQLKRMVYLENKKLILNTSLGILYSSDALKKCVGGSILLELK